MKAWTAVAFVLGMVASAAYAADRPDKVAQALRDRYGDVQTEIVGQPRDINGVKVYQVRVMGDRNTPADRTNTRSCWLPFGGSTQITESIPSLSKSVPSEPAPGYNP